MREFVPKKYRLNKAVVEGLYFDEKLSHREIAEQVGVPAYAIYYFMRRSGINFRPRSYRNRLPWLRKWEGERANLFDLYWNQKLSLPEIGRRYDVSAGTMHYTFERLGIPRRSFYKGGRMVEKTGYVLIRSPNYHRRSRHGYVYEHIVVWEQTQGRQLPEGWIIHHINGIRSDNRPENLVAMPRKNHNSIFYIKELQEYIRQLEAKIEVLKGQNRQDTADQAPERAIAVQGVGDRGVAGREA